MGLLEADILKLRSYSFQRVYNFECILPPVGISDPITVSRLVQAVDYSDYEMQGLEGIKFGAFQAFFAGELKKRPFTISFIETENHDVKRYLNSWRELIIDQRGRFKKKKGFLFGYAKPIFLNYLDNSGETTNVVRFKYAFPVTYNHWKVDSNESQIQRIDATFVCDVIEDVRNLIGNPIEDFISSKVPEIFVPSVNKSVGGA